MLNRYIPYYFRTPLSKEFMHTLFSPVTEMNTYIFAPHRLKRIQEHTAAQGLHFYRRCSLHVRVRTPEIRLHGAQKRLFLWCPLPQVAICTLQYYQVFISARLQSYRCVYEVYRCEKGKKSGNGASQPLLHTCYCPIAALVCLGRYAGGFPFVRTSYIIHLTLGFPKKIDSASINQAHDRPNALFVWEVRVRTHTHVRYIYTDRNYLLCPPPQATVVCITSAYSSTDTYCVDRLLQAERAILIKSQIPTPFLVDMSSLFAHVFYDSPLTR